MEKINLGTIVLGSAVRVTDPCYDPNVWCSGRLDILPGEYDCTVCRSKCGAWGERNIKISIRHRESKPTPKWEDAPFVVGVDSGQAGFFDADYYAENHTDDDYNNPESWYRRVCNLTLNEPCCGNIDRKGAVSESGWGDGSYICSFRRNSDGYIVEAKIDFR